MKPSAQQTQTALEEAASRKASETVELCANVDSVKSERHGADRHIRDSCESESSVQYRQFLEAEKPHVHDGGDTSVKLLSAHRVNDSVSAANSGMTGAKGRKKTEPSQPSPQGVRQAASVREDFCIPGDSGDASFTNAKLPHDASKKSGRGSRLDENDVESDNSSVHSQSQRGKRKAPSRNTPRETPDEHGDGAERGAVPSPRQNTEQKNSRAAEAESSVSRHADRFTGEKPKGSGEKFHPRRPEADSGGRAPTPVQQRSGVERSQRSGVMPPPQYSSSPARTSLSSAIGQVTGPLFC